MLSIENMVKSDRLSIDRHLLHQFLTIYEVSSVSRAAEILGVNQSSISHALERLRKIVQDPLFVRSGRGIVPTERAHEIALEAREILLRMDRLVALPVYDPALDKEPFTIMANDYEIEMVIKPRLSEIRDKAPCATLRIVNAISGRDIPDVLRNHSVDLVLNPDVDVDAPDIKQKRLFSDDDQVFYDASVRKAPVGLDDYCEAKHAMLVLGDIRTSDIELLLQEQNRTRLVVLETPTFSSMARLMKGTDIVATMPKKLSENLFADFEVCAPPFQATSFSIMQMWHVSMDKSPRNLWYRTILTSHENGG